MVVLPLVYVWGTDCGERIPLGSWFPGLARPHYWSFVITIVILEWMAFGAVFGVLKKDRESWCSIGLDWTWFRERRMWFAFFLLISLLAALIMPHMYGYVPPNDPRTIDIGPASSMERVFFVFAALTAGICEEVVFRGFAITRLGKLFRSRWIAVIVSSVCFVFLHDVPDSLGQFSSYFLVGIIFGGTFVFWKMRRLEYLIVAHAGIDAVFGSFFP